MGYKIQALWKERQTLLISITMRTIIWTLLAATSAVLACKPSASDTTKKFEDKSDHMDEYVEPDHLTPDGGERGVCFYKEFGGNILTIYF